MDHNEFKEEDSLDNILNSYSKKFNDNELTITALKKIEKTGKLIFTPEDVYATAHPLSRLLRTIFVDNDITEEYFDRVFNDYCKRNGKNNVETGSDRNNAKKKLRMSTITFSAFEEIIMVILEYQIDNIQFDYVTPQGTKKSYSTKKIDELMGINI